MLIKNTTQLLGRASHILYRGSYVFFIKSCKVVANCFVNPRETLILWAFQQKRQIMPWHMKSTFIIAIKLLYFQGFPAKSTFLAHNRKYVFSHIFSYLLIFSCAKGVKIGVNFSRVHRHFLSTYNTLHFTLCILKTNVRICI